MSQQSNLREGWHWSRAGQKGGPYSWEQLCQFAREGRIQPADLIWREGWSAWSMASQVPGLLGAPPAAPARSADQRQTKRPRSALPRLIAGMLIIAGLVLVILVVARVMLRLPDTAPSASSVVNATPVAATPVAAQPSGALRVDAQGGRFDNGEIALTLPPGATDSFVNFDITRHDPATTLPEGVTYQSAGYNLTGPLHRLRGEVQISFALPADALSSSADEEEFFVVVEDEVVSPSTGPVVDQIRLPAHIDRAAQAAHAVLALPQVEAVLGNSPALASLGVPRLALQAEVPDTTLSFRLERGWLSDALASDHFRVTYPRKGVAPKAVEQLLLTLEDQKRKIESLGLNFDNRTAWPIEVSLKDWGTGGGTQRYGLFVPSRWGANGCALQFNQAYFRTLDTFEEERREIQATAGHELFHLTQFLYEPQLAFSKATGVFGSPFFWLDEATSTWFEPLAVDEPDYLPAIAKDNVAFVNTPLYFPASDAAQGHGYGASLFLRYLTHKYGTAFIGEVWRQADNYSETGAEALDEALHTFNNLESSASLEWPSFIEQYFTQPGQIAPGLDVTGLASKAAVLKAEADPGQDDVKLSFQHNLGDRHAAVTDGWLKAGTPATLKLQFSLKSLSADAFRISFRNDDTTRQALSAPGQMRISVEAPEWSGVLVYAIPRGSDGGAVTPAAGAPWDFLSSGDPQASQGGEMIVGGLSQRDGTGDFAGLLLLPFNYASFSHTRPEAGAGTIKIELAFQPTPPEIEPTPTVEPPQPADDNPCVGLVPADIQRPSLNSKVMACRQRCVPIGGPMPSDEQLLACMTGVGGQGRPWPASARSYSYPSTPLCFARDAFAIN